MNEDQRITVTAVLGVAALVVHFAFCGWGDAPSDQYVVVLRDAVAPKYAAPTAYNKNDRDLDKLLHIEPPPLRIAHKEVPAFGVYTRTGSFPLGVLGGFLLPIMLIGAAFYVFAGEVKGK